MPRSRAIRHPPTKATKTASVIQSIQGMSRPRRDGRATTAVPMMAARAHLPSVRSAPSRRGDLENVVAIRLGDPEQPLTDLHLIAG